MGFFCYNNPELHSLFTSLPPELPAAYAGKRGTSVSQLSQAVIRGLMGVYSAYYDVEEIPGEEPLKALCVYHSRDSQYVLSKKVELWAAESHEYLYLWDVEQLEEGEAENIFARVLADGEPRVKPHSQHMSTYPWNWAPPWSSPMLSICIRISLLWFCVIRLTSRLWALWSRKSTAENLSYRSMDGWSFV